MKIKNTCYILLAFLSCAKNNKKENFNTDEIASSALYENLINQLPSFIDEGWVLMREPSGSFTGFGDSAKYTGIATIGQSCAQVLSAMNAYSKGIFENKGMLPRYKNTPNTSWGITSPDAEVGFLLGITIAYKKCPDTRDIIKNMYHYHLDYVTSHNFQLEPGLEDIASPGLVFVMSKIAEMMGVVNSLPVIEQNVFEMQATGSLLGTDLTKKYCNGPDLVALQIYILKKLGVEVNLNFICVVSKDLKLPHLDFYCGRNWQTFFKEYEPNKYLYMLELCPWKKNLNTLNYSHAGLDYIFMYNLIGE